MGQQILRLVHELLLLLCCPYVLRLRLRMLSSSSSSSYDHELLARLAYRTYPVLATQSCSVGFDLYTDRSRHVASSGTMLLPPSSTPAPAPTAEEELVVPATSAKKRLLQASTATAAAVPCWDLAGHLLLLLLRQVPTRSALGTRACDRKDREEEEEAADVVEPAEVRWKKAEASHIRLLSGIMYSWENSSPPPSSVGLPVDQSVLCLRTCFTR